MEGIYFYSQKDFLFHCILENLRNKLIEREETNMTSVAPKAAPATFHGPSHRDLLVDEVAERLRMESDIIGEPVGDDFKPTQQFAYKTIKTLFEENVKCYQKIKELLNGIETSLRPRSPKISCRKVERGEENGEVQAQRRRYTDGSDCRSADTGPIFDIGCPLLGQRPFRRGRGWLLLFR